jgi:hypothetical protein
MHKWENMGVKNMVGRGKDVIAIVRVGFALVF